MLPSDFEVIRVIKQNETTTVSLVKYQDKQYVMKAFDRQKAEQHNLIAQILYERDILKFT